MGFDGAVQENDDNLNVNLYSNSVTKFSVGMSLSKGLRIASNQKSKIHILLSTLFYATVLNRHMRTNTEFFRI